MAMQLPRIPSGVTGLRNTKMAVMMITTRFMVLHTACDLKPNQLQSFASSGKRKSDASLKHDLIMLKDEKLKGASVYICIYIYIHI